MMNRKPYSLCFLLLCNDGWFGRFCWLDYTASFRVVVVVVVGKWKRRWGRVVFGGNGEKRLAHFEPLPRNVLRRNGWINTLGYNNVGPTRHGRLGFIDKDSLVLDSQTHETAQIHLNNLRFETYISRKFNLIYFFKRESHNFGRKISQPNNWFSFFYWSPS